MTIPTLAAPFFAALKTGGPLAILSVIGGEFIASSEGIGHELFTAAQNLDPAGEFADPDRAGRQALTLACSSNLDKYPLKRLGLAPRRLAARRGSAERTVEVR